MNLGYVKKKVLRMIEEIDTDNPNLTSDPDIKEKLNDVINQVQFELARLKKIPAYTTEEVTAGEVFELNTLLDFYQLNVLQFKNKDGEDAQYQMIDNMVVFSEDGTANFFYYKYPEIIDDKTSDKYEFELSQDVLEILPYGVAADLLKSDVSSNYGAIYNQEYEKKIQKLDPRYSLDDGIFFEGGVDI